MANIRKTVQAELTDGEKEILCEASKILEELADVEGADELYDMIDIYDTGFYDIACILLKLVENSD